MQTTSFRPDIDGFAFKNHWINDAEEREELRQILRIALPAAAGVLVPVIAALSPVLIPVLGPAAALIAPFLPILPCIAPTLASRLIDSIADDIADHATGRCAGMAYSSADYFLLNWVLPSGKDAGDQPKHMSEGGTAASDWLRNYIWQRQLDSHLANGVTFLSWIAMTKLFGDYGREWVCDKTREEMSKIQSKIAAGVPWPIGLLSADSDLTKSHVVVALSFQQTGTWLFEIGIYDNVYPDQLCTLSLDLSGSQAVIAETKKNSDGTTEQPNTWLGVFLTNYQACQPRPAMYVTADLTLSPGWFASAKQQIAANFSAEYAGFDQSRPLRTAIGHGHFVDKEDVATAPDPDGFRENAVVKPSHPILFKEGQPGAYSFVPKAAVYASYPGTPSYKTLPRLDGTAVPPMSYIINPIVPIKALQAGIDKCMPATVEGGAVNLVPDVSYFSGSSILGYSWQITGGITATGNQQILKLSTAARFSPRFMSS